MNAQDRILTLKRKWPPLAQRWSCPLWPDYFSLPLLDQLVPRVTGRQAVWERISGYVTEGVSTDRIVRWLDNWSPKPMNSNLSSSMKDILTYRYIY